MTLPTRLGGFKILKGLAHFSMVWPDKEQKRPADLYSAMAQKKINLPYCAHIHYEGNWGVDIIVESIEGLRVSLLFEEFFGRSFHHVPESAVISVFPHKKNPEVIGKLLEVFERNKIAPGALGHSPSAVSIILRDEEVRNARNALFEPFSFSAYRTPEDWKLAQKGNEQLYKEVIATYQEQRPKVYGLELYEGQQLLLAKTSKSKITQLGWVFNHFAACGIHLTFTIIGPAGGDEGMIFAFSLQESSNPDDSQSANRFKYEMDLVRISPVCVFSMNGPHFGDRYGIASELLRSLDRKKIELLCLSCTIASITGVLPAEQTDAAVEAIQDCFDVPAVIKK
ncbi:MAG: hypothetical protein JW932_01100 [Deltaproteobacteria bacterium]|nr:hypothetical protein [Deltaproteobacteria bacterium]